MNMMLKSGTALAASTAVAVAAPTISAAAPVPLADSRKRVVACADLVALGEQLKPVLAEYLRLDLLHSAAYEHCSKAGGHSELGMDRTDAQQKDAEKRFAAAAKECGYHRLSREWNAADRKARRIAKQILKIDTSDTTGYGIHAAAALALDEELPYEGG
jgi:hypothetical protein